jgi:tetratricopeptide (TPR) repeat protein
MKKRLFDRHLVFGIMLGIILFPLSAVKAEEQVAAAIPSVPSGQNQPYTPPAVLSTSGDENANDLRLDLDRVTLLAETGKFDDAFKLIDQMKEKYPNNSQVLAAEADLNFRIGNNSSAFVQLNKALLLDPGNEDILQRQQAEVLSQGANVSGGFMLRNTDEAYEQLSHATFQSPVNSTVSVAIDLQNDHLHSRTPIIRADGTTQNFSGDEQSGTLLLNKVLENNNEVSGSLYANATVPGAGLQYSWWDHSGVTKVRGEYNRPDWDYVEMVIGDGTKSDFWLERKQVFTNNFNATLGGGYNHYALHDVFDAAQSLGWDANVEYTHPYALFGDSDKELTLNAYYTADAEYFTSTDEEGPLNAQFKPLPVTNYEIHAFNVGASKKLSSQFFAEGYAGYGVNRIDGSNGPLYGAALSYTPVNKLGIEVRGSRTRFGGENNDEREDLLGLNIKWML